MSDYNQDNSYTDPTPNTEGGNPEHQGQGGGDQNQWQQSPNSNSYYNMPDYNRSYQGYGYQQGYPGPGSQPPRRESNPLAVTSMVVGIFSIVTCCASPLGIVLGILGIVLAILSKKGQPFSGFAIAGLVLSGVGIVLSLLLFAYYILVLSLMRDPEYASIFNAVLEQYEALN